MTDQRAFVNDLCRAFPGTEWSESFGPGHDVWKVGGKIFAVMGSMDDGVSLKTPDTETATMLIDTGVGERAPYLHRSWVRLPPGADRDEIRHRVEISYDTIRASLSKRLRDTLADPQVGQ